MELEWKGLFSVKSLYSWSDSLDPSDKHLLKSKLLPLKLKFHVSFGGNMIDRKRKRDGHFVSVLMLNLLDACSSSCACLLRHFGNALLLD